MNINIEFGKQRFFGINPLDKRGPAFEKPSFWRLTDKTLPARKWSWSCVLWHYKIDLGGPMNYKR